MLNALIAKHPVLAGVHPMNWTDATRRQVLCGTRLDTAISLRGSASYLTPGELAQLAARGTRGAVVMHYAEHEVPIIDDLGPLIATASFAREVEIAHRQLRVGRFALSHLSNDRS